LNNLSIILTLFSVRLKLRSSKFSGI